MLSCSFGSSRPNKPRTIHPVKKH